MGKQRATLYLLIGYPGAGKTTTSQIIHDLSGAVHIWADYERRVMFREPTHSKGESQKLYNHLNRQTELLLADGQSVIFDTNFNFRKDRDHLREIAAKYGVPVQVVWIKIDKAAARKRALHIDHAIDNHYPDSMKAADFNRIVSKLEPPDADEDPIDLDGSRITPDYVADSLGLPRKHLKELDKIFRTAEQVEQYTERPPA
jgi:predicted kinase